MTIETEAFLRLRRTVYTQWLGSTHFSEAVKVVNIDVRFKQTTLTLMRPRGSFDNPVNRFGKRKSSSSSSIRVEGAQPPAIALSSLRFEVNEEDEMKL